LATNIVMPALGLAQETGTLLKWFIAEGQAVAKGEPLMLIETDKTTVEIEAPAAGVLAAVTARVGDVVPVGRVIALLLAPGEAAPKGLDLAVQAERVPAPARAGLPSPAPRRLDLPIQAERVPTPARAPAPARAAIAATPAAARIAAAQHIDLSEVQPAGRLLRKADLQAHLRATRPSAVERAGRPLASPKARRLAAERGIDLATISGSGPDRAVLAADVLAGPAAAAAAPALTMSAAWRLMAERTTQSWTTVPHFFLLREVAAGRLVAWRESRLKRRSDKVTYSDLLVMLVAAGLRQHPRLNASWRDGAILANDEINIGLAVGVEEGLIVPVMHEADALSLSQIAARRQELVARAQAGKLLPDDLRGGTFTISNLGMYGVDAVKAIINPPQAAILAVGRIAERVVALHGRPEVQPMLMLSLSCDHRVVDGVRGAQFLQTLAELIEEPLALLDT